MSDALQGQRTSQRSVPGTDEPITVVGRWYHVKTGDTAWLGCVTRIGSNYVKLVGPHASGSTQSQRIHFTNFDETCTPVNDIDTILAQKVETHRAAATALMEEVKALTAKLGLAGTATLAPDTQSLVLASNQQPIADYKAALVLAERETLPALFRRIEEENKAMATWMKASLIPLEATVEQMKKTVCGIKDRIFNVELYAGLVEQVKQITNGKPPARDERIRLMQRRCYMDEECLAAYEAGGMDINGLDGFDDWLGRPENRDRILPFPRCIVAFRVRRNMKDRPWHSLGELLSNIAMEQADKSTFIYIRNGEQLYRLETRIEFEEKLFPDLDRQTYTGKLWVNVDFGHAREVIPDRQYQGILDEDKAERAKMKATLKKDRWLFGHDAGHKADKYVPVDPSTVFFDDANAFINGEVKKHNRIALILQGLLDRSPVLHPHPPWRLWTDEDFTAALELIFDDSRTLTPGEAPDFEAYRAECNTTIKTGSLTIGQEAFWSAREARKGERHIHSMRHYGDPGPKRLARVTKFLARSHKCIYEWERDRVTPRRWRDDPKTIRTSIKVPVSALFNVDAYTPGDIKRFFADPRTRADYLKWAPLLIDCEKYHAGLMKKGETVR